MIKSIIVGVVLTGFLATAFPSASVLVGKKRVVPKHAIKLRPVHRTIFTAS